MSRTLFIDSTPDIDRVWKQVHGPGDIAIAVNMGPVGEGDIPGKVAGYETVINDATYFNEATLKRCSGLKHIVFLGTGAASFVDLAAAQRLGIKVSTIGGYGDTTVAEHAMGLVFAAARHIATMHGIVRVGRLAADARHGTQGEDVGHRRPGRHRPRDGAHCPGCRPESNRLQSLGRCRRRRAADADRRVAGEAPTS